MPLSLRVSNDFSLLTYCYQANRERSYQESSNHHRGGGAYLVSIAASDITAGVVLPGNNGYGTVSIDSQIPWIYNTPTALDAAVQPQSSVRVNRLLQEY